MTRINPIIKSQVEQPKLKPLAKLDNLAGRVSELAKEIGRKWDSLDPETLAGKIIDLKAQAKGSFPGAEQIREKAANFHFQFVFPITRDLKVFSKSIERIAKKILATNSIAPFQELSKTQKAEILRNRGNL